MLAWCYRWLCLYLQGEDDSLGLPLTFIFFIFYFFLLPSFLPYGRNNLCLMSAEKSHPCQYFLLAAPLPSLHSSLSCPTLPEEDRYRRMLRPLLTISQMLETSSSSWRAGDGAACLLPSCLRRWTHCSWHAVTFATGKPRMPTGCVPEQMNSSMTPVATFWATRCSPSMQTTFLMLHVLQGWRGKCSHFMPGLDRSVPLALDQCLGLHSFGFNRS